MDLFFSPVTLGVVGILMLRLVAWGHLQAGGELRQQRVDAALQLASVGGIDPDEAALALGSAPEDLRAFVDATFDRALEDGHFRMAALTASAFLTELTRRDREDLAGPYPGRLIALGDEFGQAACILQGCEALLNGWEAAGREGPLPEVALAEIRNQLGESPTGGLAHLEDPRHQEWAARIRTRAFGA